MSNDWIPIGIAALSLLGSILSFYFSKQERESQAKANDASYYSTLVADLRSELDRFRAERDICMKEVELLQQKVETLEHAIRGS